MSAFIVEKSTVDAIVTYAVGSIRRVHTCRAMSPNEEAIGGCVYTERYTPQQIGQILWDENRISVDYRYREKNAPTPYVYSPTVNGWVEPNKMRALLPIDVIKLCHCLEYQSCEHAEWDSSWAKDFLDRVVSRALRELPGYEDAPWGLYHRPANRDLPVSIKTLASPRRR